MSKIGKKNIIVPKESSLRLRAQFNNIWTERFENINYQW